MLMQLNESDESRALSLIECTIARYRPRHIHEALKWTLSLSHAPERCGEIDLARENVYAAVKTALNLYMDILITLTDTYKDAIGLDDADML